MLGATQRCIRAWSMSGLFVKNFERLYRLNRLSCSPNFKTESEADVSAISGTSLDRASTFRR